MPSRRSRIEPLRADVLADAPREDWLRELGWILDLDLSGEEVPGDLRALQRGLGEWDALDRKAAARVRRAGRVPHPALGGVLGVGLAVSAHLFAVGLHTSALDRLVFPVLVAGIALALALAGARRALSRPVDTSGVQARVTAALRGLGARSALLVIGEQVVEVRAWLSRLVSRQAEARATIGTATERLREVEATTAQIRSANGRLGRPLDDPDTAELVAVRARLAGEIQALTLLVSELDRRRFPLEARVEAAAAEAERHALSRRAAALADRAPAAPRPGPPWVGALAEVDAEVLALETAIQAARGRLVAVEGSARLARQAAPRRPTSGDA